MWVRMSARKGWNIISKSYQEKTRISLEDVHYGPISAGESKLKLLGDVAGKDILEVGCGGGQNAIVLEKWGARSSGMDISEKQIEHARKLAKKEGVQVHFYIGSMENLDVFRNGSFDIVLSSFAVGYVDDLAKTVREMFRVLRKNGLFVFCDVHPIADRGRIIRHGRGRTWKLSNYFDKRKHVWTWKAGRSVAKFYGRHRTIQDYFNPLVETGFIVERILEPEPLRIDRMSETEKTQMPYVAEDYLKNYDMWKRIPYTILFKARKP
jgi:ubiquinone/menaquinone biosynthesis C-methylase UbiE